MGESLLNPNFKPPALKISGQLDNYRPHWAKFYTLIRQSPVKVLEVDWNDQTNLILKTELGAVHFGAYSNNFAQQLKALDQMRHLSSRVKPTEIAYIDLRNPDSPTIQMNTSKTPVKLGTP